MQPNKEARIRAAVERLHYVPNHGARGLARGRTGVIGIVVPELTNPFFAGLADEVIEEATARDLSVLVCSTRRDAARESRYSDLLAAGAVDGMVYVGMHRTNDRLAASVAAGLPVCLVDEPLSGMPDTDLVLVDNFAGAFQATSHLLSLGHRRIVYLSGPPELHTVAERRKGYCAALEHFGVELDEELIFTGEYSEEFGINVLPHLLSLPVRPSAVFAGNDLIAVGLLVAADQYGLEIPTDMSVVGFDDIAYADNLRPRLTSIRQPIDAIAKAAVARLMARIEEPTLPPGIDVLPVTLIARASAVAPGERYGLATHRPAATSS